MITILIILGLLAGAGYFKGLMDSYVDTGIKITEWKNKYDFSKPETYKHWWYLGFHKPTFPEKFPFSSTILVFLTDKWHLSQFFMLRCMYVAISWALTHSLLGVLVLGFVVFPVVLGFIFETTYQTKRQSILDKNNSIAPFPTGDEPNDNPQVTSVPEKQIEDEQ